MPTITPRAWTRTLALTGLLACGPGRGGGPPAPERCPDAVPLDQPARFGSVFLDGRRVGVDLPVRRTGEAPEAYELLGPEPEPLAALPVERIDLVQYARGPDAEARYGLCPGTVAVLISTRSTGRPSPSPQPAD